MKINIHCAICHAERQIDADLKTIFPLCKKCGIRMCFGKYEKIKMLKIGQSDESHEELKTFTLFCDKEKQKQHENEAFVEHRDMSVANRSDWYIRNMNKTINRLIKSGLYNIGIDEFEGLYDYIIDIETDEENQIAADLFELNINYMQSERERMENGGIEEAQVNHVIQVFEWYYVKKTIQKVLV